jgi:hypothetical protein
VDVDGSHHGPVAVGFGAILDAFKDSLFALTEDPALALLAILGIAFPGLVRDSGSHSKTSVDWNNEDVLTPQLFQNRRGFSSFFSTIS